MLKFFCVINFCEFYYPRKFFNNEIFPDYGNALFSSLSYGIQQSAGQIDLVIALLILSVASWLFTIYIFKPGAPGFLKLFLCGCLCLCLCVCLPLRLLITSGVIWTPYDWLKKVLQLLYGKCNCSCYR